MIHRALVPHTIHTLVPHWETDTVIHKRLSTSRDDLLSSTHQLPDCIASTFVIIILIIQSSLEMHPHTILTNSVDRYSLFGVEALKQCSSLACRMLKHPRNVCQLKAAAQQHSMKQKCRHGACRLGQCYHGHHSSQLWLCHRYMINVLHFVTMLKSWPGTVPFTGTAPQLTAVINLHFECIQVPCVDSVCYTHCNLCQHRCLSAC